MMRSLAPELLRSPRELAAAFTELMDGTGADDACPAADTQELTWLRTEGYAVIAGALTSARARSLCRAMETLHAARWPPVFVFMLDDVWRHAREIERTVSLLLGHTYELLEDAWAWSIAPGERGWKPHRGGGSVLLDREAPELLTAWTALSDVTAERACMHVVPLDEDPHYPNALDSTDAPLASVRAVPVTAGTTVVWNANVLHWGGACSPRAEGRRISLSVSLGRMDARGKHGVAPLPPTLTVEERLDLIAAQVVTYQTEAPELQPAVRDWARATQQLRIVAAQHFAARKER
ncbi:MAG: phytanoyl-CoA dioxygenase family protein [Labilithrix sp.]|nr:phytanoyl-CoA dioxygenase family protein [Labilithrix sp.]MCW5813495.1 phytanoyl-CoA dioxygenase family protein [Labilithrix sp.]